MKTKFFFFVFFALGCASGVWAQCDSFKVNFGLKSGKPIAICAPGVVSFVDSSITNSHDTIARWSWTFGDGGDSSMFQNPFHAYLTNGTYDVTLKAVSKNGCRDSITKKNMLTFIGPSAEFSFIEDTVCFPDSVGVFNSSSYPLFPALDSIRLRRMYVWGDGRESNRYTDSASGFLEPGKWSIGLEINADVYNPRTGKTEVCTDIYPNLNRGEKDVWVTVLGEFIDIELSSNGGFSVDIDGTDKSNSFWVVNSTDTFLGPDSIFPTNAQTVCFYFQNGNCMSSDCVYNVSRDDLRKIPAFEIQSFGKNQYQINITSSEPYTVEIIGITGQRYYQKHIHSETELLNLSSCSPGVYLIRAVSATNSFAKKVFR